jgi:hypothetical protein
MLPPILLLPDNEGRAERVRRLVRDGLEGRQDKQSLLVEAAALNRELGEPVKDLFELIFGPEVGAIRQRPQPKRLRPPLRTPQAAIAEKARLKRLALRRRLRRFVREVIRQVLARELPEAVAYILSRKVS